MDYSQPLNEDDPETDYLQPLNNDDPEIDSYRIDSIQHVTATEEKALWREYIKWRHIKSILESEGALDDIYKASLTVISRIIEEVTSFNDLIILLRHHIGLDKVGDRIIEDEDNTTLIRMEINRFVQQYKEVRDKEVNNDYSKTCCLEDLFGCILGVSLNNIAFGRGNPDLVNEIAKATNRELIDITESLFRLAINRSLLPKSLINVLGLKTPLNKLPNLIKSSPPIFPPKVVSDYYLSFIERIKIEGEKARQKIIESHLWLVVDIVNKQFDKDLGLPSDDLIQEGNLGLIEAVERFKPTFGARYMSYAPWWIYQKIHRAIGDQARTIRIPIHLVERINELQKTSRRLTQEYGREPTSAEIAKEMEISSDKVREMVKASQLPISLESPISEEKDSPLDNSIEDRNDLSPEDAVSNQLLKEQIEDVLFTLTPREKRVLQLRFGLDDGRSRTLEEVGKEFNVTRERIRQIEAKALRKLRHPSRSRKLKDFL